MAAISNDNSYARLLKQIQQEISEGLSRAQRAYEKEKVIAYWRIGKAISLHLGEHKENAEYGKQLYASLARDLHLGERLLYQISQFYNTYPTLKPSENLKWSHYRLLATIPGREQRSILEHKVSNNNWSPRELDSFIKEDREKPKPKSPRIKKLSLIKGRLYTYSVFKDDYAENTLVDCGFNIYRESNATNIPSRFVETAKVGSNDYNLVKSNATAKHLYTYKAYVKKIIDGDTIWVIVDCGFKTWVHQKLRLRGIDAPGITTKEGMESYKFVCEQLKGLPFVVIKTHGRDKYDRYLADILYLEGSNDPQEVLRRGVFLNQRLLDNRLAINE